MSELDRNSTEARDGKEKQDTLSNTKPQPDLDKAQRKTAALIVRNPRLDK